MNCDLSILLRVNNSSVTSDKNSLRECHVFYKTLYTAEPINLESQDWLLDQLDTALTADDQHRCEGELTLNEYFDSHSCPQTSRRGVTTYLLNFIAVSGAF